MSESAARSDQAIAATIKCILSDVDGVFTDGRIVYDSSGAETKAFHVRDGLGIKTWMREGGRFGIITARHSPMVARRAEELGVHAVVQNAGDKWLAARRLMDDWDVQPSEVAYVGDDLPDLSVMPLVGLSVAPADAATDVLSVADWTMQRRGGEGVIRELIERLMRAAGRWPTPPELADGRQC
mgnify:CR=1 FL=1